MSHSARRWADIDEDDEYEIPVPLAFMIDDGILQKLWRSGLPEDDVGLMIQKLLVGTDLGNSELTPCSELSRGDIAHIKEQCYWFRNGYRPGDST